MTRKALVLLGLILAVTGIAQQSYTQMTFGYPFDTPVDPRSVAMGESFVAVPSNPAALQYNPAGLAGLHGLGVSYSSMSQDWYLKGVSLYSINATVGTSFGVFGAQYNRKVLGSIPVTTAQFPDGNGSEMKLYSHDFAIGYAYRLPAGVALGVSAKYYDFVETISGSLNGASPPWTSTPAYLFDFGIMYTLPRLHSQTAVEDSITLGLSYQNIGTRWKFVYPPTPGQWETIDSSPNTGFAQLPEYFRIGLSYALRVRPAEPSALTPFAAVLSGEFRSLQAPIPSMYSLYGLFGPISSNPETSYWGIGLECTILEYVSLRGGAAFRPYVDVEAERDRPSYRYGAGVNLPLERLGADLPLTISAEYSVIPVSWPSSLGFTNGDTGTFPVFSFEVRYTGSPW
jgi:hypothetical protein